MLDCLPPRTLYDTLYASMSNADAGTGEPTDLTSEEQAAPHPRRRAGVTRTAWWLSTRRRRPEWQSLTGAGVASFMGRPRAHFESAQPGDPVLLYVARPDRAIRAVGIVTHAGAAPPGRPGGTGEAPEGAPGREPLHIEVQFAFEVPNPLPWQAILAAPELTDAEPVRQRSSGTLFYLNPAEYRALQARIVARNPELAASFAAIDSGESLPIEPPGAAPTPLRPGPTALREVPPAYRATEAPARAPTLPAILTFAALQTHTGLPAPLLAEAHSLLIETRQIVLIGPPGTGKTWLARGLATLAAGDPARAQVVQFHPATTYEDFIEGLKPSVDVWGHVTYAVLPGLFARLCTMARADPLHPYVLVIDEINRAPLARVFGELLYALEYRGPTGAVELSVSAGTGKASDVFYVPENLLIIGTMNSADRSLALVDYALRRRFRFIEIAPNPAVLDAWLAQHEVPGRARQVVITLFNDVNRLLSEQIDPDHCLGHSYFMLAPLNGPALDRLWRTAIRPLIAEYFIPPTGEIEEYERIFQVAVDALGPASG